MRFDGPLHASGHDFCASGVHHINPICSARRQHKIDLPRYVGDNQWRKSKDGRTPKPFMNRQQKFKTRPTVPGTKCVTRPETRTESGTRNAADTSVALNLSSGIHSPPRRVFHLIMARSDNHPAAGAPTRERYWLIPFAFWVAWTH
jgi:hypothetical protein